MSRTKPKPVDPADFELFLDRGWHSPVALQGTAIPAEFGENPEARFCGIIASGERTAPVPYQSAKIPNCHRVGGMFIYRVDEKDAPNRINRDDYMLVESRVTRNLYLEGPFADPADHRSPEFPPHHQSLEVVGSPKKVEE